jgi:hypothetical protein
MSVLNTIIGPCIPVVHIVEQMSRVSLSSLAALPQKAQRETLIPSPAPSYSTGLSPKAGEDRDEEKQPSQGHRERC